MTEKNYYKKDYFSGELVHNLIMEKIIGRNIKSIKEVSELDKKEKEFKRSKKEIRSKKRVLYSNLWYLKRDINQLLRQKTRKDTTFINSINKNLDILADDLSFWVLDENTISRYKKDLRNIIQFFLSISHKYYKYAHKRKIKDCFDKYLQLKPSYFLPLKYFKENNQESE